MVRTFDSKFITQIAPILWFGTYGNDIEGGAPTPAGVFVCRASDDATGKRSQPTLYVWISYTIWKTHPE